MNNPQSNFPWVTTIIALTILILAGFALVAYLRTGRGIKDSADRAVDKTVGLVDKAIDKAAALPEKFRTGTITQTFRESIPEITSTHGDILELAVARSDETFTRKDERRIGWNTVYLGTTVAEIRAPVTFRYHLRLSDSWRLASRDNVCYVLAPAIRPSLPPAIHTDQMEKRAESGWARFDKGDRLAELEKSMLPLLEQRASDPAHLKLVQEACRQSVAAFVKTWLVREEQWDKHRFNTIVVVFPDEIAAGSDQDLLSYPLLPTLRLE